MRKIDARTSCGRSADGLSIRIEGRSLKEVASVALPYATQESSLWLSLDLVMRDESSSPAAAAAALARPYFATLLDWKNWMPLAAIRNGTLSSRPLYLHCAHALSTSVCFYLCCLYRRVKFA